MTPKIPLKMRLLEIRPEFVEGWKNWGTKLMGEYNAEALLTLAEEKVLEEHMFLLQIEEKWFLAFFSRGENLPANIERQLNRQHRSLLEESVIHSYTVKLLYSLG